jgi:hypothetical protein
MRAEWNHSIAATICCSCVSLCHLLLPSSPHSPSSSLSSPPTPGLISTRASPYEIALQAIEDAAYMCKRYALLCCVCAVLCLSDIVTTTSHTSHLNCIKIDYLVALASCFCRLSILLIFLIAFSHIFTSILISTLSGPTEMHPKSRYTDGRTCTSRTRPPTLGATLTEPLSHSPAATHTWANATSVSAPTSLKRACMPLTDASTDAVTPFLISAASYYLMHTTLVESHTQQIPTLTHSLTHTHTQLHAPGAAEELYEGHCGAARGGQHAPHPHHHSRRRGQRRRESQSVKCAQIDRQTYTHRSLCDCR